MANTDTKLGIVAILPVGAWVSASTYEYLNLVTYGGGAYLALQDVPSGTALSNTAYWMQITEKGLKGDKGDKGDTGAKGDTGNGIASVSVEEVSVEGAEHNYRMTVTMTDGTITTYDYTVTDGAVTSVNGRTGEVIGLAEQDGYYELMSVGSADQLISTQYVEDSVPYKFRTSGGSADIGDREIDEIVGGTIAWNQLVEETETRTSNGITTTFSNGVFTYSGTATSSYAIVTYAGNYGNLAKTGHVYVALADTSKADTLLDMRNYDGSSFGSNVSAGNRVFKLERENSQYYQYRLREMTSGTAYSGSFKIQMFDLTAMFGSTIADYIYNLEQSTAGAGVAWFKKLFPNDFYPYSVPTLTHVSGLSSHDMVGFNQWDEEWEVGSIGGTTGENVTSTNTIRSKNYIPCIPLTSYFYRSSAPAVVHFYDADKNYLGNTDTIPANRAFTSFANAQYMRFRTGTAYGTTYNHDICINLSWSGTRNGEYEPYVKHSYPLDSSLTLMGIPKLDADGNLYFDGDVYASDGTVQKRYGIVDLGTLTWVPFGSTTQYGGLFYSDTIKSVIAYGSNIEIYTVCDAYVAVPNGYSAPIGQPYEMPNKAVRVQNGDGRLYIRDDAHINDNGTAFKSALNGVYMVYELATPTTETAQPYTNPQIVNDWGTEEYVSETIVPVGHRTDYTANLRDKLQHLPDLADSDGYYMIQQTGTNMNLIRFRIPQAPTTDGTYTLQATVSGGTPTYTWVEVTE